MCWCAVNLTRYKIWLLTSCGSPDGTVPVQNIGAGAQDSGHCADTVSTLPGPPCAPSDTTDVAGAPASPKLPSSTAVEKATHESNAHAEETAEESAKKGIFRRPWSEQDDIPPFVLRYPLVRRFKPTAAISDAGPSQLSTREALWATLVEQDSRTPTKAYPGTYHIYKELRRQHPLLSYEDAIERSRVEYIRRLRSHELPIPKQGLEYTFQVR